MTSEPGGCGCMSRSIGDKKKICKFLQFGQEKEKEWRRQLAKLVREISPRTQLVFCWKPVDGLHLVRWAAACFWGWFWQMMSAALKVLHRTVVLKRSLTCSSLSICGCSVDLWAFLTCADQVSSSDRRTLCVRRSQLRLFKHLIGTSPGRLPRGGVRCLSDMSCHVSELTCVCVCVCLRSNTPLSQETLKARHLEFDPDLLQLFKALLMTVLTNICVYVCVFSPRTKHKGALCVIA